jgi:nucleotide-binding universal stress UspA family protein
MRLVVGYLATPSGEDGLTLGVRLARTLGVKLDLCMVLPPDGAVPGVVPVGVLAERAEKWLADAVATVPKTIEATPHVTSNESFAQGLIDRAVEVEAEAIVLGAAGDGLVGRYSIGSVTGELSYSAPVPLALAPRGTRYSKVERVREVTCAIGEREGADLLLRTAVRASEAAGNRCDWCRWPPSIRRSDRSAVTTKPSVSTRTNTLSRRWRPPKRLCPRAFR